MAVPQLDGYVARRVHPVHARKPYRCPACGNGIEVREGHVVAWPEDVVDLRRHWHHHCWRLAVRRGRVS